MSSKITEYSSHTYKLVPSPDVFPHSIYFTIVGQENPIAFFVNSKDMSEYQWITITMTSLHRQIQLGRNINGVIEDMEETFQPKGDYIIAGANNKRANSIVHHLGILLRQHVEYHKAKRLRESGK